MYQKNQNQTQVPNLNNASVQHPSTSQPGGMVPEARQALEDMKYEIAGELGINLKQGYNGDLPSRHADGAADAAPETTKDQRAENTDGIAEMDACCVAAGKRDLNLQKSEDNIR